jgi:hypothetical protein
LIKVFILRGPFTGPFFFDRKEKYEKEILSKNIYKTSSNKV